MIAVIADDLTGAAELAGIGLRYGLSAELALTEQVDTKADLIIICTDSRSMTKAAAQRISGDVMKKIISLNPGLIYKKIDSVLRGHVLDELKIQLLVVGKRKALVVPANPSLGRTIKDGNYFIGEKPIAQTDFTNDPEFSITDSSVVRMINAKQGEVIVLKHTDPLPEQGIVIGEAMSAHEMTAWANKTGDSWLLAGAGDFFVSLLEKKYSPRSQPVATIGSPHLYISGTAFDKRQAFIKETANQLGCVMYLPPGNPGDETWINKSINILKEQGKLIIAIDKEDMNQEGATALIIRNAMARATSEVVERAGIKELFIEGGSTAAAVLKELDIKHLVPLNELQRGVVRMNAKDMYITVKPGSYELPEQISKLYSPK
jgi:uncharacterized protein YgbK (DUF1537 family)